MSFLESFSVPVTLIVSIALAAVLVYIPFLVVAYGRFQAGYDPAKPRALFDKLPAYAQRATWAHENSFESFMLFTAGALMAYVTQVSSPLAVGAAISYVSARSLFSLFYLLNLPLLRSMMFAIGSLSIATLMGLSIRQVL
jgi:uncharacterized MAPEG superfamily protein